MLQRMPTRMLDGYLIMNLLTRLRELSAKASRGPWFADMGDSYSPLRDADGELVADFDCGDATDTPQGKINSLFVEILRNNIDKLLDVCDAARVIIPIYRKNCPDVETATLFDALAALDGETNET